MQKPQRKNIFIGIIKYQLASASHIIIDRSTIDMPKYKMALTAIQGFTALNVMAKLF